MPSYGLRSMTRVRRNSGAAWSGFNLRPFECTDVSRSSFIKRVCYDRSNEYMLINLNGTYYHYCLIDNGTVSSLLNAGSMGRFYNASIKGHFDCRVHQAPTY
jgi:KTSC domain